MQTRTGTTDSLGDSWHRPRPRPRQSLPRAIDPPTAMALAPPIVVQSCVTTMDVFCSRLVKALFRVQSRLNLPALSIFTRPKSTVAGAAFNCLQLLKSFGSFVFPSQFVWLRKASAAMTSVLLVKCTGGAEPSVGTRLVGKLPFRLVMRTRLLRSEPARPFPSFP